MQVHQITTEQKQPRSKRVGRGGRRGKTSGRGHKGQKARAGHKIRPAIRDDMKRRPKLRGRSSNRFLPKSAPAVAVNLSILNSQFASGETVSPDTLLEKKLIRLGKRTRQPRVKVLARGQLERQLTVSGCEVSSAAREAIEQAGGQIS